MEEVLIGGSRYLLLVVDEASRCMRVHVCVSSLRVKTASRANIFKVQTQFDKKTKLVCHNGTRELQRTLSKFSTKTKKISSSRSRCHMSSKPTAKESVRYEPSSRLDAACCIMKSWTGVSGLKRRWRQSTSWIACRYPRSIKRLRSKSYTSRNQALSTCALLYVRRTF